MEKNNYFNKEIDINTRFLTPLEIYNILSTLNEEEQIIFLRENIEMIKKFDEKIFLYKLYYPVALADYFSFDVIKEIYDIDKDIFNKILTGSADSLFNKFNQEDYLNFYKIFYKEINELDNEIFINYIICHNKFCYYTNQNNEIVKNIQFSYNNEFMKYILQNYNSKLESFSSLEMIKFISNIDDFNIFMYVTLDNKEKISDAFNCLEINKIIDFVSSLGRKKQFLILEAFSKNILKNIDIKQFLKILKVEVIIYLYENNNELFSSIELPELVKIFSYKSIFDERLIKVLDGYQINQIEDYFDNIFYENKESIRNVNPLRYIEKKYRNNISNKSMFKLNNNESIFSDKYFSNLKQLKRLIINKEINKDDYIYQYHLLMFINYIEKNNLITGICEENYFDINILFHKIVLGKPITVLYEIETLEDVCLYNRIDKIDLHTTEFSINQIKNYNVKEHKQLCKKFNYEKTYMKKINTLLLKAMLVLGYDKIKILLNLDNDLSTLEYLFWNIDVKNIHVNKGGIPELNERIVNILFNDKKESCIKKMLQNKSSDLYKYFPRLFNEWENIQNSGKSKNIKNIIDYLKADDISVPEEYHRLVGKFKYIGCDKEKVEEAKKLHDKILKRTETTIPSVSGIFNEYSYKTLDLHDMDALTLGARTSCCLKLFASGYPCLIHATTNINGRILVIYKNNQIVAHSWVWRNGNTLCFDNIEIIKDFKVNIFLVLYLKIADEFIKISKSNEYYEESISNVLIGVTRNDKEIIGIKNFPCYISSECDLQELELDTKLSDIKFYLPKLIQPLDYNNFSDSSNLQFLIKGSGDFKSFQSEYRYDIELNKTLKK